MGMHDRVKSDTNTMIAAFLRVFLEVSHERVKTKPSEIPGDIR